ncbi:LysM peptidoglycan-binding domain-containing protein [Clostridium pasteurianum]|uniref:Putative glycosyl hydrolase n=1 Tax=Clostridium pasteurianum BC1 TaxID=86416 RepID=R4JX73_CLOPA|nr:LysM domain-containing protein [Clostridium pasteurianum]AGK95427.1 putative glycosyl hydrolase [Clostridium pasteurianum BC1]
MKKIIIKFLGLNIHKTDEENRTFRVGIVSTLLLETGIIFTLFKHRDDSSIKFILLAIIVAIICILMLISIRLYDVCIFLMANYIIYTVKKGDNLLTISEQFLPECNPWRTSEIIKNKNNIEEILHPGQKILIPSKREFFI